MDPAKVKRIVLAAAGLAALAFLAWGAPTLPLSWNVNVASDTNGRILWPPALSLRAVTGATNDIMQWQDSNGLPVTVINASGQLQGDGSTLSNVAGATPITLQTNGGTVTAGLLSLNLLPGANVTALATNAAGAVDLLISSTGGGGGPGITFETNGVLVTMTNLLVIPGTNVVGFITNSSGSVTIHLNVDAFALTNGFASIALVGTLSNLHLGTFGTLWTNYAAAQAQAAMQAATNYADANDAGQAIAVFTNSVGVTSLLTNLDIIAGTNVVIESTNADGHVTISINAAGGGAGGDHYLLSSTHLDTTAASAVDGDMLYASGTNWTRLPAPIWSSPTFHYFFGQPRWLASNECWLSEEFISGGTSATLGWSGSSSSGGSYNIQSTFGAPGTAYVTVKATNASAYAYYKLSTISKGSNSVEVLRFRDRLNRDPNLGGTNGIVYRAGFSDSTSATIGINCASIVAGTNWSNFQGIVGKGMVWETNDLGVAVDTQWHVKTITWLANSNVVFQVDSAAPVTNSNLSVIPHGQAPYIMFEMYSVGTVGDTAGTWAYVDRLDVYINKGDSCVP